MSSSVPLRCAVSATLLTLGLTTVVPGQTIPAFSGADGAAANVPGGRGGIVYHVTKLNSAIDDPQRNDFGTIRYGLNSANFPANTPRTIVFDVGGVFNLGRLPQVGWDPNGNGWDAQSRLTVGGTNVTLAGQTAPGAGVIFMGGGLKPQGNNNIIRNVTIASGYGNRNFWDPGDPGYPPGDFPDSYVYDAMDISGTNLMIDHVSASYATDETVSMNELANNITVQYSSMSQAQNYPQWDAEGGGYTGHALGSLLQAGSNAKISFHHNLYAHLKGRLPRVGSEVGTGAHNDFRNNVFYNWLSTAGTGASGQPSYNKFVSNLYLAGDGGDNPVGGTSTAITNASGGTSIFNGASTSATRVYHAGNLKDTNKDADANDTVALTNSDFGSSSFVADGSFTIPYAGVTDTATVAFNRVLDYMGANWWNRSAMDARLVNEVRTGTGKIMAWADDPFNTNPGEGTEWRAIKDTPAVSRALDWDVEADNGYGQGDGMPTWWELAHGLNPGARDDAGDFDSDGYTNLEEYLNEVAEWPAPGPIVFSGATNNRYAQITNWTVNPGVWQPSKYDTAQINSGTVIVDAVGQHAGTLQINNTATLSVTGGWINVATATVIGANASLNQSGGYASVAAVSGAGSVNVSGGVLSAGSIRVNTVTLNAGLAQIAINGTSVGTSKITNLAIGNGQLDLTNNKLVVTTTPIGSWDGSTYTGVTGMISSGRNGGTWDGSGIATSLTDAQTGYTSIGVATASESLGIGSGATAVWSGQTVTGDDALVMYTYAGDANLTGVVDVDDYGQIDFNASVGGVLTGWFNGDFDYSGSVDVDDYGIIDFVVNIQGPPFGTSTGMIVSTVPEPSAACGIVILAALLPSRRKRR